MKKVLALVASVTMLVAGLLVSCSDDGTQDVYLTNFDEGTSYEYYGTFSGTAVAASYTNFKVDEASFGSVEWKTNASNEKSNMRGYELNVPYTYTTSYSGITTTSNGTATIRIGKIGSKYYNQGDGKEVTFSSGSPESSSFTISTVTYSNYYDITFTNLSFQRAD